MRTKQDLHVNTYTIYALGLLLDTAAGALARSLCPDQNEAILVFVVNENSVKGSVVLYLDSMKTSDIYVSEKP